MKIVHVAVTAPYTDGWGYQENILPFYQNKLGDEVIIIASDIVPEYIKEKKKNIGSYIFNGLRVIRIHSYKISNTLIVPSSFFKLLEEEKPDIIFHHNVNCTSLITVARYHKKYPDCTVFCDNHADYINHSKNKLWQLFYYKLCIGGSLLFFQKYIKKFYGVTLQRCDYLREMFGIPQDKIDFLPIGADVDEADKIEDKTKLRMKYKYTENDFIIASGGKMGKGKGTDTLIKAIQKLHQKDSNFKLILFGKFEDKETELLAQSHEFIHIEGWCDRQKTLEILKLASVAVWPIHHTTLVEDSIAVQTPLILCKTRTTEHLIEKNGIFIQNGTIPELYDAIEQIKYLFPKFKAACKYMHDKLSYNAIAAKIKEDATKINSQIK